MPSSHSTGLDFRDDVADMALVSMLPLPFRFKLKAEREQYPDEPFTPKPFPEGAQDAYRHYIAQTRSQRENNWTRDSVTATGNALPARRSSHGQNQRASRRRGRRQCIKVPR